MARTLDAAYRPHPGRVGIMDVSIDCREMGDLAGWPFAIHAEVGDSRLPARMVVASWRARLGPRRRTYGRTWQGSDGSARERFALSLIGLPVVLVSIAIRHRLRML